MKFNIILCSFIAILFNCILITNSTFLLSSDLHFNIPEVYRKNFSTEDDFEQFLKNLICKLKIRLTDKLLQSFQLRNNIKKQLNKEDQFYQKEGFAIKNKNEFSCNFFEYVKIIKNLKSKSFEKMINKDYYKESMNININNTSTIHASNNLKSKENFNNFSNKENESLAIKLNKKNESNLVLKTNNKINKRYYNQIIQNPEAFLKLKKEINETNFFYDREDLIVSNKSFYDFSNIFFKTDKSFQTKIFGKRLVDFFNAENSTLNDDLLDAFIKFSENLKFDKEADQEIKISKFKKKLNYYSRLESGKNQDLNLSNLRSLKISDTNKTGNLDYSDKNNTHDDYSFLARGFNYSNEIENKEATMKFPDLNYTYASPIKRIIKIYINQENECDVYFDDSVYYEANNYTKFFMDHIILNGKSKIIQPREVKASDAFIDYYIYNRKMNMFTLEVEKKTGKNFSINYDYTASGLISSFSNNDKYISQEENNEWNFLKWKIYNENFENKRLDIEIEVYLGLGNEFNYESIKFNYPFEKQIKNIGVTNLTYFSWKGSLLPYEVMKIETIFPLIFKNCGVESMSSYIIILGSLFIIYVIITLYLMIVNLIKDFY